MEISQLDELKEGNQADASQPALPPPPPEVGYCLKCGYDMRGLGVQTCPECGTVFDEQAAQAHNQRWCRDLIQQMRIAHLVTTVGCAHAAYRLLTGEFELPLLIIIGLVGLALAALYTLAWLPTSVYSPSGPRGADFARRCGRGLIIAAVALVGIPVVIVSGRSGAILLLSAGLLLTAIQGQRFVEGRRRGHLFGVEATTVESVSFAVGVSKFFGVVSIVLLVAVLAVR